MGIVQFNPNDRCPVYDPEDTHRLIELSKSNATMSQRREVIVSIFEKNLKQMNVLAAADMVKRYPAELAEAAKEMAADLTAGFRQEREELKGNSRELMRTNERNMVYSPLFDALASLPRDLRSELK